jgi:hypothetical protein
MSFDKGTDKDTEKDTGKLKPGVALTHAEHDRTSFFCSELVATAFQELGILREINPSEITPEITPEITLIDLCRFLIYHDEY